jgi:hypothetical protein
MNFWTLQLSPYNSLGYINLQGYDGQSLKLSLRKPVSTTFFDAFFMAMPKGLTMVYKDMSRDQSMIPPCFIT